jgi:hypothetical protein
MPPLSVNYTPYPVNVLNSEGLKDRPQEVKETLFLCRKLLFAFESHLFPQAMQK